MSPRTAVFLSLLAVANTGMTCGPAPAPPPPDDCASGSASGLSSVEIGPEELFVHPFERWEPIDTAYTTFGPQGGEMIGITFRLPEGGPACLAQRSQLHYQGALLAEEDASIKTYPQDDGSRTTRTLWLVFEGPSPHLGDTLELTTEVSGQTIEHQLTVVTDRNRVVAIDPPEPAPVAGTQGTLEIRTRHAPAERAMRLLLETDTPSVLQFPEGASALIEGYDEDVSAPLSYLAAGTADVIVTDLNDGVETRQTITVAPATP